MLQLGKLLLDVSEFLSKFGICDVGPEQLLMLLFLLLLLLLLILLLFCHYNILLKIDHTL
ncbi:hypothetical protein CHCC20441_4625 [Bacillus licheniformis]|nr:hypothetical protein CHCC20440_0577 [Bacillus licheniformis]TWK13772.1 hypothetical protein CHCC20441_4625 [Bacillus licheniformis]TWK69693.1 hypothetical protein CHCC20339_1876 [Bacillus licheniformis]TWK95446.1 hypothetical protein CHCC20325_0401 [Bacillus licheniformis]TWN20835.1 hypothetical protein CHCC14561_0590 [Bacillus licheniformis]